MSDNPGNTLWAGDIDSEMDEDFIKKAMKKEGIDVITVKIIRDKHSGMSMGYGFISFADEQTTLRVLSKVNGTPVYNSSSGKNWKLNYSGKNQHGGGSGNNSRHHYNNGLKQNHHGAEYRSFNSNNQDQELSVFVGFLSSDVDDTQLLAAFKNIYPSAINAKVISEQSTGQSKGFGFVKFANYSDYQAALSNNKRLPQVGSQTIKISNALPRGRHGYHGHRRNQHNSHPHHRSGSSSSLGLVNSGSGLHMIGQQHGQFGANYANSLVTSASSSPGLMVNSNDLHENFAHNSPGATAAAANLAYHQQQAHRMAVAGEEGELAPPPPGTGYAIYGVYPSGGDGQQVPGYPNYGAAVGYYYPQELLHWPPGAEYYAQYAPWQYEFQQQLLQHQQLLQQQAREEAQQQQQHSRPPSNQPNQPIVVSDVLNSQATSQIPNGVQLVGGQGFEGLTNSGGNENGRTNEFHLHTQFFNRA